MNLTGSFVIAAPVDTVAKQLYNPQILGALLPYCQDLRQVEEGQFVGKLVYTKGMVPIKMEVRLSVTETGEGVHRMVIDGGNFVTGHAKLETEIMLEPAPRGCRLGYAGDLTTTGLLKRIASQKEKALTESAQAIFHRFKNRVERPGKGAARA